MNKQIEFWGRAVLVSIIIYFSFRENSSPIEWIISCIFALVLVFWVYNIDEPKEESKRRNKK